MRLSEAIMLGSTTCALEPQNWNSCAYGAALNANGVARCAELMVLNDEKNLEVHADWAPRIDAIGELWPWTWDVRDDDLSDLASTVYEMFDEDVCDGKVTIDALVDYVRSIEPDCDCNRFNCTCKEANAEEVCHANTISLVR